MHEMGRTFMLEVEGRNAYRNSVGKVGGRNHLEILFEHGRIKESGQLSGIALGYGLDDRGFESR
jgi:hypothetical protein